MTGTLNIYTVQHYPPAPHPKANENLTTGIVVHDALHVHHRITIEVAPGFGPR